MVTKKHAKSAKQRKYVIHVKPIGRKANRYSKGIFRGNQKVRVCRGGAKWGQKKKPHSQYCPPFGIRYDGIYKVVDFWPEKGKSGIYSLSIYGNC